MFNENRYHYSMKMAHLSSCLLPYVGMILCVLFFPSRFIYSLLSITFCVFFSQACSTKKNAVEIRENLFTYLARDIWMIYMNE